MTQVTQTTLPKNTKFEKARVIGSRALQISQGAPFLVELNKEQLEKLKYNPVEIAKLEFEKGLLPIDIKRKNTRKFAEKKQQ